MNRPTRIHYWPPEQTTTKCGRKISSLPRHSDVTTQQDRVTCGSCLARIKSVPTFVKHYWRASVNTTECGRTYESLLKTHLVSTDFKDVTCYTCLKKLKNAETR